MYMGLEPIRPLIEEDWRIGNLEELHRQVLAIKLPTNERAADQRPVVWNRAIGRLRFAVIHLLKNQALLLRSLQESADSAGVQVEDVKPTDNGGGNGGDPAKE